MAIRKPRTQIAAVKGEANARFDTLRRTASPAAAFCRDPNNIAESGVFSASRSIDCVF